MEIVTQRLVLREFVESDWADVLAYQRDPRYLRYYPWSFRTEADVRDFVQLFLDWQWERPRGRYQLALTLKGTRELIGNCGIRRNPDRNGEAEIGYELAPTHWGKGYATEAARVLVNFGFRELGIERVSSWCIAENTPSARVLTRLGFQPVCQRRHGEFFKGRWWDTLHFALAREAWERLEWKTLEEYRQP